jgi:hypothetical protein
MGNWEETVHYPLLITHYPTLCYSHKVKWSYLSCLPLAYRKGLVMRMSNREMRNLIQK